MSLLKRHSKVKQDNPNGIVMGNAGASDLVIDYDIENAVVESGEIVTLIDSSGNGYHATENSERMLYVASGGVNNLPYMIGDGSAMNSLKYPLDKPIPSLRRSTAYIVLKVLDIDGIDGDIEFFSNGDDPVRGMLRLLRRTTSFSKLNISNSHGTYTWRYADVQLNEELIATAFWGGNDNVNDLLRMFKNGVEGQSSSRAISTVSSNDTNVLYALGRQTISDVFAISRIQLYSTAHSAERVLQITNELNNKYQVI